jgi:hypothetical protein
VVLLQNPMIHLQILMNLHQNRWLTLLLIEHQILGGENAKIEYVGVDDEKDFHGDLVSDDDSDASDYIPDSNEEDQDNCEVDDEEGCYTLQHVTDLENPTIAEGVTFEDGATFKRAIRQYGILNEIEIAANYSESTRYRGHCKANMCRWRIHASQLQDGKTWMVKLVLISFIFLPTSMYPDLSFCVTFAD